MSMKEHLQQKRLSRIKLEDSHPKYFWEFKEKHKITSVMLDELRQDEFKFQTFYNSLKKRGQQMFSKLFNYKYDAHYVVSYAKESPYNVSVVGLLTRPIKFPPYFKYDPERHVSEIVQAWQQGREARIFTKTRHVESAPTVQKGHVVKIDMDPWTKMCPDKLFYFNREIDKKHLTGWLRDLTMEGIEPNPGPKGRQQNRSRQTRRRRRNSNAIVQYQRPGLIMPPRHKAILLYVDNSYVRNNPGSNYLVYSFRINDLNDPDPLILSGGVSGFKEMMQFYLYYRVLSVRLEIDISNNEAFDIMYGGVFSQQNLTGTISSRDDAANALENNYAKGPFLLSEKTGMDRGKLRLSIRPSSLLGVPKQYYADTNYSGIGLATPAIPLWVNFIVFTPTGSPMVNGYSNATKITFQTEFFGRTNIRALS